MLTVVTGFVAIEEIGGTGVVTKSAKGDGGAVGGAGFLLGHLKLKAGLFQAGEAPHAASGRRPYLDTACFEERGEGRSALIIENDGAGEDAMAAAVLSRPEFALGRFGPTRLGAVGTRGLDTTFRTHLNPIVVHDCFAEDEVKW